MSFSDRAVDLIEELEGPKEKIRNAFTNEINLVYVLIILILIPLLIFPLFLIIQASLWSGGPFDPGGHLTLDNYIETYLSPSTYTLLGNTLIIAVGTAIFSCSLGVSMAWAVARTNTPYRRFISFVMLVPYPIPGYLLAVSYIFLLDPQIGWINTVLSSVFGFTVTIYSLWGIIFISGLSMSTLPYLIAVPAFRNMDPSFEDAARMSGAGVIQVARDVTLPISLPSITAAAVLVFAKTLDTFSIPVFIGLPADPPIHVFATKIWDAASNQSPPDYALATALSTTLLLIGIVALAMQRRATGLREKYATVTGSGYSPDRYDLGKFRWVIFGVAMLVLLFSVILPLLLLLVASVSSPWIGELWFLSDTTEFTLEHYYSIASRADFKDSVVNSLTIGVVGATLGMLFITMASYLVIKVDSDRSKLVSSTSPILDQLLFLPAAIPGVVMGLGLFWVAIKMPTFGLYGTIWLIMLGYIARELPVGSRTVYGSIIQIDDELEEQSHIAGASWFQTVRKVTFPLLTKGFLAGWLLLFTAMIKKLTIPIFLYTYDSLVLPVMIFQLKISADYGPVAIAGLLIMAIVLIAVVAAYLIGIDLID